MDASPWPLICSLGVFCLMSSLVETFHGGSVFAWLLVWCSLAFLLCGMGFWFRDIVREGTLGGCHTVSVQLGFRYGMLLFIVSELFLFVSIFWAFFWSAFGASIAVGSVWPPLGVGDVVVWRVPFLNTVLLLSSGVSVTWAHHCLVVGNRFGMLVGMCITVGFALVFVSFQCIEYVSSPFSMSTSVFGSVFYLATGFHGLHVVVGVIMLCVCLFRFSLYQLTRSHHFGFEGAAWYWHFVDVVWLILFVSVYCWGS